MNKKKGSFHSEFNTDAVITCFEAIKSISYLKDVKEVDSVKVIHDFHVKAMREIYQEEHYLYGGLSPSEKEVRFCPICGKPLGENKNQCNECGNLIDEIDESKSMKEKLKFQYSTTEANFCPYCSIKLKSKIKRLVKNVAKQSIKKVKSLTLRKF